MTRDEIKKCVYEIVAKALKIPLESVNNQTEIPPQYRFYIFGHVVPETVATLEYDYQPGLTAGQIVDQVENKIKENLTS